MSSLYTYTKNHGIIDILNIPWLNYTMDEIYDIWIKDLEKEIGKYYDFNDVKIISKSEDKIIILLKSSVSMNSNCTYTLFIKNYFFQLDELKSFLKRTNSWIIYSDENYIGINRYTGPLHKTALLRRSSSNSHNCPDPTYIPDAYFQSTFTEDNILPDQFIDLIKINKLIYFSEDNLKIKFLENTVERLKEENCLILDVVKKLENKINFLYKKND